MEGNLCCFKLVCVEQNVLLRIFDRLLNKFDTNYLLGVLTETEADRASAAADVEQHCAAVDTSEFCDQGQHLFEDQRVYLEERERAHREIEPAQNFFVVTSSTKDLPRITLFIATAEVISCDEAERDNAFAIG